MSLRNRCAQQTWRSSIAQKPSAVARSLTRMPPRFPNSGANVTALPLATILNTVATAVAMVHSERMAPAWNQLVPSVCFTAAASTFFHASSTGSLTASLTRSSMELTAPRETLTPKKSARRLAAERRPRW